MNQPIFLTIVCSGMGVMLFVFGFFSLQSLMSASSKSDDDDPRDPFASGRVLSVLFATNHQEASVRRLQRRTIWLFCGSAILLFVARQVYVGGAAP